MRFLFRLFLLFVLVVILVWVFRDPLLERLGGNARAAASRVERSGRHTLSGVDLDPDRIAAELKRTGRVVRRKAEVAVDKLDLATRDTRTSAKLKARYALDPELKDSAIDVDTKDGRVTLSGRADSPEQVAHAIRMALQDDNVSEVTSTLQVTASRSAPATPTPRTTSRP